MLLPGKAQRMSDKYSGRRPARTRHGALNLLGHAQVPHDRVHPLVAAIADVKHGHVIPASRHDAQELFGTPTNYPNTARSTLKKT